MSFTHGLPWQAFILVPVRVFDRSGDDQGLTDEASDM